MKKPMQDRRGRYSVISQQMGVDCNENDEILIRNFRGVLTWVYAEKTPAIQSHLEPLSPATPDNGGFEAGVTIRCDEWPVTQAVPLRVGQEVVLPDAKGHTLRLQYKPTDHVAVVFINADERGFIRRVD